MATRAVVGCNSLTLGLQHGMAQSQESRLVNGLSKLVHRNYALCFYPGELCSFYLEGNLTFGWVFCDLNGPNIAKIPPRDGPVISTVLPVISTSLAVKFP